MGFINIKASDVASICGLNPYKSRDDIFNERINTYFGTRLPTAKVIFEDTVSTFTPEVQKVVKNTIKSGDVTQIKDVPEQVREYVRHEIYKDNGTKSEKPVAQKFSVQQDKTCYTMPVYRNVRLIGFVDGVKDGKIVEIKNRQNRLFGRVPEYERVQCMTYMKLTNAKECILIENFEGKTNQFTIEYDESYWNNRLFPNILSFAHELYGYQNGEDPLPE